MNETLSVAIPCHVDEPGLGATLESLSVTCAHRTLPAGLVAELLICINGAEKGTVSEPLKAIRNFCLSREVALEEIWIESGRSPHPVPLTSVRYTMDEAVTGSFSPKGEGQDEGEKSAEYASSRETLTLTLSQREREPIFVRSSTNPQDDRGSPFPRCTVLLTERRGKPPAWNTLWREAKGTLMLFVDADVQIDAEAVFHLWARLQQEPGLQLVAAREVPVLTDGGTLWSRMGAIPYRFNFGNAGGRLLLLRREALPDGIPEDLLLEDAWLTVAIGKHRVAKEMQARVFFLPPATGRDYFAERVRTEGGKLQIRRLYQELLAAGPIAQYHWSQFWRELRLREYPLLLFALVVRGLARLWARLSLTRKDFYALYRPFTSTKKWESRTP